MLKKIVLVQWCCFVLSMTVCIPLFAQNESNTNNSSATELDSNRVISGNAIISVIEVDFEDASVSSSEEVNASNISGILTGSRDVFLNTAGFTFGTYRFQLRGYDPSETNLFMNNIDMSDMNNGRIYWSLWGGLNDAVRNRTIDYGLAPSEVGIGNVGGLTNLNTRASNNRPQTRVSYAVTNRSYRNRLMATHSNSFDNGLAFTISASKRWAQEGYVDGTFYDSYSYFAGLEYSTKNKKHAIGFTSFGTPTTRGKQAPTDQQSKDIVDDPYYNPYWGFQNGEKRNSRVFSSYQPVNMLTYRGNISDKFNMSATVAYQFGKTTNTALDWFNAADPRPDYYRGLPGEYEQERGDLAEDIRAYLEANPHLMQIQWDELIRINQESLVTFENVNGSDQTETVNFSHYIIEGRVEEIEKISSALNFNYNITDKLTLNSGASFRRQKSNFYRSVEDLLGGEFYIDLNRFADQSQSRSDSENQNDLSRPNRLLTEGDKFGHDYDFTTEESRAFAQLQGKYKAVDFHVGGGLSYTRFWRTGNVQNGLFPETSLGDSEKQEFIGYTAKAGATYKLDGRNFFLLNGMYITKAPLIDDAFLSERTRNDLAFELENEVNYSVEGGYLHKGPKFKARAIGYFTEFKNEFRKLGYYSDVLNTFSNLVVTDIDRRNLGLELAVEAQVHSTLKVSAIAAVGQNFYTDRASATLISDNENEVQFENELVYWKNNRYGSGPQSAYGLGLSYTSPKYFFLNLNASYFTNTYLDPSPVRKYAEALDNTTPGSPEEAYVLEQRNYGGNFTLDFFGGYSWKINKTFDKMEQDMFLYINLGVSNILNNQNFVTGGFENLRYNTRTNNQFEFQPREFYAYGTTYFLNTTLRF